ncbi:sulfotransferase (plasmid) [Thalassoporum mexicanum PCC 7367]|nr:sulfotransferase [Pseudanabaena sp. PCC 7367]
MARSASTWSYNVCKSILAAVNQIYNAGYVGEFDAVDAFLQNKTFPEHQHILLKAHTPGKQTLAAIVDGQIKNIFTYRDPRDSLCSRMQFEGKEFKLAMWGVIYNLIYYDWYQNNSQTLFINFKDIMGQPAQEIARIADYLGVSLSKEICEQIAIDNGLKKSQKVIENLSQLPQEQLFHEGERVIDKSTLLQTGHIAGAKTGRWRDELDRKQQIVTNTVFAPWLVSLGYETEASLMELELAPVDEMDWYVDAAVGIYQIVMAGEPEYLQLQELSAMVIQLAEGTFNYVNR